MPLYRNNGAQCERGVVSDGDDQHVTETAVEFDGTDRDGRFGPLK